MAFIQDTLVDYPGFQFNHRGSGHFCHKCTLIAPVNNSDNSTEFSAKFTNTFTVSQCLIYKY